MHPSDLTGVRPTLRGGGYPNSYNIELCPTFQKNYTQLVTFTNIFEETNIA